MIKKLRVTVDGKPFEVTVEMDDESALPPTAANAPARVASVVSTPVAAAPSPASSSPGGGPAAPGDVPSPLAGRVAAVNVEVGQAVKEGDHLLTLEAMKMNTFVMAPRAGTVKEIKVAVGAAVEEGQGLVTLA